jgi:choline kinase
VRIELVVNDRAEEWNNAYSLWCARDVLTDGALLVNGDTVHPAVMEERLLAAPAGALTLAIDDAKTLGDEEMKVRFDGSGTLVQITKLMDPLAADGEYVGLSRIDAAIAGDVVDALEATWRRDPSLYYEDGYGTYADRGGRVQRVGVGGLTWVEVDDHVDLARARTIACHC